MNSSAQGKILNRAAGFSEFFPDSVTFRVSETMLGKSIIDASFPIREALSRSGVHDFARQGQGSSEKRRVAALFIRLTDAGFDLIETTVSLYRPNTKSGDPRFWPRNLNKVARAGDVLVIGAASPHLLVLTNISEVLDDESWAVLELALEELAPAGDLEANAPLRRLVRRLREIAAGGPLIADGTGDTAVGRTLETALGIKMNSSRLPDWEERIELKFGRDRPQQRLNLFAKVPDWKLSPLKGSGEILREFGYESDGVLRLSVTVRNKPNPQGLFLVVDEDAGVVRECSTRSDLPEVVVWRLITLQEALLAKHPETCWITCDDPVINGVQHFLPTAVTYTRSPRADLFGSLISVGDITLDHLIKLTASGGAHEQGPLWKVSRRGAERLLPYSEEIRLL